LQTSDPAQLLLGAVSVAVLALLADAALAFTQRKLAV
jgi:ABC-type proline/glycine betaine transport system permease subunit